MGRNASGSAERGTCYRLTSLNPDDTMLVADLREWSLLLQLCNCGSVTMTHEAVHCFCLCREQRDVNSKDTP